LKINESRASRPLIFLMVLMSHAVIVLVVIREGRLASSTKGISEPLLLMLLNGKAAKNQDASTLLTKASRPHTTKHERLSDQAITVPPEIPGQPNIDWEHEAELASQNALANTEKESNYRNLSGLSAAQLNWIQQNHMKPAAPGIEWQHPRFEFDRYSGLPVFWLNDRCVLITLMVFCGIGHVHANGDLFRHMRDP
jgi:hypothetical protein